MTLATTLDDLAHALADDGITAHEPEIAVAGRLFSARLPRRHLLVAILLDRTASSVARERAFGLLAVDDARAPQTAGGLHRESTLVA